MVYTSTDFNWVSMRFKLSRLFYQNSISAKGPGSLPYLSNYSGSSFKTFLIYLVQVMIDPSKTWALSLSGVVSELVNLWEGRGSMVLPLI